MYAAIDLVTDKMLRRVSKYHDKVHGRNHHGHHRTASRSRRKRPSSRSSRRRSGAPDERGRRRTRRGNGRVVKNKQFELKPMSIEEAALQMELVGHDFFVFTNVESQPRPTSCTAATTATTASSSRRRIDDGREQSSREGHRPRGEGHRAARCRSAAQLSRRIRCRPDRRRAPARGATRGAVLATMRRTHLRDCGSSVPVIKIVEKILRAGEGRRMKSSGAGRADHRARADQRLTDEEISAKTAEFRGRLERGETLEDLLFEAFAVVREGAKRALGMRPFDVQLMGGMVLFEGDIAEMKTGEGKTLVATMPMYLRALPGNGAHLVTVNDYLAKRDAEWMGPVYRFMGMEVGVIQAAMTPPSAAKSTPPTSPTAPTPSSASTTCATTWPCAESNGAARPLLLHRRRGGQHPGRRGAHAAHHQRRPRDGGRHVPSVRAGSAAAAPRRRLRGRREAAHGGRHRERRGQGRKGAQHRQPLHGLQRRPGQPLHPGAARRGALQQGRRVRGPERRGAHRRRVHRPHPGRTALLRGPAPGDRGQGAGRHPRREPDAGYHHPAELLPSVRGAGRHDRYGQDGRRRVPADLRPARGADPHERAHGPRRQGRLRLQDRRRNTRPWWTTSPSATRRDSPSWSVPSAWRSASCSPVCWSARACRTTSSTPSSTSARRPSSWTPAATAPSLSPPTWPAAA